MMGSGCASDGGRGWGFELDDDGFWVVATHKGQKITIPFHILPLFCSPVGG